MQVTHTGHFPLALRRGSSAWQCDLDRFIGFAKELDIDAIDVEALSLQELRKILDAGLRIGCVDLINDPQRVQWTDLASPDPAKRQRAVLAQAEYVNSVAQLGVTNFFAIIIPEDTARDRKENFDFAVDGVIQLTREIESSGARVLLEGWPGRWPHFSSLACTPAECRAFLNAVGSESIGINYDPSHLIRMGINPLRFLREFIGRVHHVHAKDAAILSDAMYEFGTLQPCAVAKPHVYGGLHWRYTIPGNGLAPWPAILDLLHKSGYRGTLSIELEDEQFYGSDDAEKRGFTAARDFLVRT